MMELNKLNLLLSLESANCYVESSLSRLGCEAGVMDDLITNYTTPWVKAAEPVPGIGKRNTGFWEFIPLFAGEQEKSIPCCQIGKGSSHLRIK